MTERNSGLRALLTRPEFYEVFQRAVGASNVRRVFAERYVRAPARARVLDVGCGPGVLLDWLGDVEYVGFDLSERYIDAARRRYGARARFELADAGTFDPASLGRFDYVVAFGVLHHLDDATARRLFATAADALTDGGRVITIDPCFTPGQSRAARELVARDRGRNVRSPGEYRALAAPWFDDVAVHEHHDLLRIPYSHAVLEAGPVRVADVSDAGPPARAAVRGTS